MVDVSDKATTVRSATATASVLMAFETAKTIQNAKLSKGDVLGISRIAAIHAVKSTSQLIPLCHAIPIEAVAVSFQWPKILTCGERNPEADNSGNLAELSGENDEFVPRVELRCEVEVRTTAKTGVEMEAMTGASVAGLTIYDMIKSIDRGAEVSRVRLLQKSGGKSGDFVAQNPDQG